jgi:hypothetical protein
MTNTLIETIAALNKKGAKELIDHKNFDVRGSRFFLPVSKLLDALTLPDNSFKHEGESLEGFVQTIVEGSRAYHEAHKTGRQNLGYEILTGEDADKGEVVCLVVFTGRPLNDFEKFMSEQLSKLAEDEVNDFDTMLNKLKTILEPKAFDTFRAVLSKANIGRQQWNASRKKDPDAKPERYTGHGGAGSGIIWNIPPEKLKGPGKKP